MQQRPSWDELFMEICDVVAKRGTCDRKQVGAVLVRDHRIIATGYNGSIPSLAHCSDPEIFYECMRCGHKTTIPTHRANGQGYVCCRPLCRGTVIQRSGGHDIENLHCQRAIHAEINVIAQAARLGIAVDGAVLYCNTHPCWHCFKTIVAAGIQEIVYKDEYNSEGIHRVKEAADMLNKTTGFILRRF